MVNTSVCVFGRFRPHPKSVSRNRVGAVDDHPWPVRRGRCSTAL